MYIHIDKRNGAVMEITSYRVPGGKYPKQHTVYIGKMDENGTFVPNRFFIERSRKEELQAEVEKLQAEVEKLQKELDDKKQGMGSGS